MGSGSGIAVSCGVGHRCGSDSTLLWLWRRPAAVAPIRPLVWEPPYAMGVAPEKANKTKTKNKFLRVPAKSIAFLPEKPGFGIPGCG